MADQTSPDSKRTDKAGGAAVSSRSTLVVLGALAAVGVGAGVFYFLTHTPHPVPTSPTPQPADTAARFTLIEGMVKVQAIGRPDWLTAFMSTFLRRGDQVRTGSESSADIKFVDNTVLHVRPESLITIEETSERRRRIGINSGVANFKTSPGASGVREFHAPNLTMQLNDEAEGDIQVAKGGDSRVKLFKGSVDLRTTGGQNVRLGSREAVTVDRTGQAGPKLALPAAPTLASPVNESEIQYANPANSTTLLLWKAVPGATSYHVTVDLNPQFNRPLVDRARKGLSIELFGLDAGKYYWRVAGVNDNGIDGSPSDVARFSIARSAKAAGAAEPPALEIEAVDVRSNILQVRGKTEPGATVTVNGHAVDVQPDGTFNEFVTLERAGKQDVKIRAVGSKGGTREVTRSVLVAY